MVFTEKIEEKNSSCIPCNISICLSFVASSEGSTRIKEI